MGSSSDEYYQAVVINALLSVLKDPSLQLNHFSAIEAIMNIFRTQGLKAVAFLPEVSSLVLKPSKPTHGGTAFLTRTFSQIVPALLNAIKNPNSRGQEYSLQQLAQLVWIIKQHVRNYLPTIFDVIMDIWAKHPHVEVHVVALIESIARALNAEFKPYLSRVLSNLLKVCPLRRLVHHGTRC